MPDDIVCLLDVTSDVFADHCVVLMLSRMLCSCRLLFLAVNVGIIIFAATGVIHHDNYSAAQVAM